MIYPFKIKFVIINEYKKKEFKLFKNLLSTKISSVPNINNLVENINKILESEFNNDSYFNFINEKTITINSKCNEKKLLMYWSSEYLPYHHDYKIYHQNLNFFQPTIDVKQFLSINELKYISKKIKNAIEKYLGYQINNPIIYLEIE